LDTSAPECAVRLRVAVAPPVWARASVKSRDMV
jgi:hypothetical protein